ncbi:protein ILITYHIA-like isoform X2 [Actinidia eriantha]|uniref:protein ILITYHIA-like isoform X2 n=1 Tax=Actinidia eriantha TaxID=165200 RepID=UPI0025871063|nr:protein ILITYHIA-like isoform X2 [Actinidia eriantha]
MCKNADAVVRISSLVPLIQIVKTGYTKETKRLDGVYALLCFARIAVIDIKTVETLSKEEIWSLLSQSEPSLASKLFVEDCWACVYLLEVLLVDHPQRVLESISVKILLQFVLYSLCHPSWDIRRVAYDATKKITPSAQQLSEAIFLEFSNYLSIIGEKGFLPKKGLVGPLPLGALMSDNHFDQEVFQSPKGGAFKLARCFHCRVCCS